MRSRRTAIAVAVVIPVVLLVAVVALGGGSKGGPARLPIAAGGAAGTQLAGGRADAALYPYGGIVYKAAPGLPELGGTAFAYTVSRPTAAQMDALASAFGLANAARGDTVTYSDGDRQLTIDPSGGWGYSNAPTDGVASSGVAVACAPDAPCPVPPTTIPERPANLPTQDDAKKLALQIFEGAGFDANHATVTVDDYITQWSVRIDPIVDGLPVDGFGTFVTIGDGGKVEFASGAMGTPHRADEYPLIGTRAAIDRLNEGRGLVGPVPLAAAGGPAIAEDTPLPNSASSASRAGGASGATGGNSAGAEPAPPVPTELPLCDGSGAPTTFACVPPTTGTLPPPEPQVITVDRAEQVLLYAVSNDGKQSFLVPAYRFGDGPTVLAIDDRFLAPPPASDGTVDSGSGSDPAATIEGPASEVPPVPPDAGSAPGASAPPSGPTTTGG